MKLTLKNNFHSTSVELECSGGRLSAKQVANARKTLCGVSGCTCGGNAGERGPQRLADGRRFAVVPDSDGGCCLTGKPIGLNPVMKHLIF